MQQLHERFSEAGLRVLAFPCNQFGNQEPGTHEEIAEFARDSYGVNFPLHAKIEVNGDGAHPLYEYLKAEAPGLLGTKAIKWNFTKFLVARDGKVLARYAPKTSPLELVGDIEKAL